MNPESKHRKAGRPRGIPEALVQRVLSLHAHGSGYRAIARELGKDGLAVDWSTVRRVIKSRKPDHLQNQAP